MKEEKDNLTTLFNRLEKDWDFEEPESGHQERFFDKIQQKKKTRYWMPVTVAASVILCIGSYFMYYQHQTPAAKEWADTSPKVQEIHFYFTAIIDNELEKVTERDTPENKKIIADAIIQMQKLDSDYEKIKLELLHNGENKQLIFAMLTNLKTRISFLEDVLHQIDNNNKLNKKSHENNML
ncbi:MULTISPECIES: anti-sigma factor [Flavobacterium]|uniref:anti-sigma factor n=1 Tax=Flavobacterium TaxID=237 RepID=UPI0015B176BB|nr:MULTISPECIES: anti-sigma factor [Flavobacterium]